MYFNLSGKKALVTGASGGIGQGIASVLSKAGAEVCLSGTREQVLKEIELPGKSHICLANLSEAGAAENLIQEAHEKMGGLDILICNAGITKDGLVLRMKEEDFQKVINVNLTASFALNKAAVKLMLKAKYGRIINISSIVAVMGNAGQANYCASKAGLIGMSKAIALETAARGVTVNTIAPGFIDTPMTQVLTDEQKSAMHKHIPVGYFGQPEDVAYSALFLASSEASYITGQTLHVNGGMLMI
jgi:3-oxoacyl-[acyl-carrier protein] reductase